MIVPRISHHSLELCSQLRDGITPIEACAFNGSRRELLAVDAGAARIWGLRREIKTIMVPQDRYTVWLLSGETI